MDGYNNETSLNIFKVEWSVIEHFSIQGRPDPRGTLCCFGCPNKTLNLSLCASDILTILENGSEMRKLPPLGTSDISTIIKNKLDMRKLWPPKIKGFKNSQKQPPNITKVGSQTPKKS
jgi:hypothetical protein